MWAFRNLSTVRKVVRNSTITKINNAATTTTTTTTTITTTASGGGVIALFLGIKRNCCHFSTGGGGVAGGATSSIPNPLSLTPPILKSITDYDRLYVWESASGEEPVVLLHDIASTFKCWLYLFPHLNHRRFKYIVPDLLGHGRSPRGKHLSYDLDTHLFYLYRDVFEGSVDIHSKRIKRPAHLIGHGLGAIIALEIASRTPQLVQSLTLIGFPYSPDKNHLMYLKGFHPANHVLLNNKLLCAISCNIFRYNSIMWMPLIRAVTNKPSALVQDSMQHCTTTAIYSTFQSCILNYSPNEAAEHLYRIGFPFTLIHGSEDEVVPLSQIQRFFTRYTELCQLDIIDGAGHDLILFNIQQLATHLNKGVLA